MNDTTVFKPIVKDAGGKTSGPGLFCLLWSWTQDQKVLTVAGCPPQSPDLKPHRTFMGHLNTEKAKPSVT